MNIDFTGQVAIVTGSGTGIGYAAAELFARCGAAVVVNGRRPQVVQEAADKIAALGARVIGVAADVSTMEGAGRLIDEAVKTFGGIDVLVNNAAIFYPADFVDSPYDEWRRVLDVNLDSAIHCSRAAAKVMIAQGRGGRIVNVSSIHSYRAERGASHYDLAKGAMDQLTRALALELGPHNILVNSLAPGFVDTPMSIVNGKNELESEWFITNYVQQRRIPLARASQPIEIAHPIVWLASRLNTYVNGHVLVADGGLSVTF
ncbi:MAG: SDR family oxidoreductase [Anaerolineae bacterium]|nr:SDR family oxidoreductase [Thermoflexales bacterium]MDW8407265.1 SDR family oxidoreductase [Anaerolineae bacterium]